MSIDAYDISEVTVDDDPLSLQNKISAIRMAGPGLMVLSPFKTRFQAPDFDATLTKYFVNGCRGQIMDSAAGNPEFDAKRQALYEYYHTLEVSPTIPIEEKTKLMEEWLVELAGPSLIA